LTSKSADSTILIDTKYLRNLV